MATGLNYATACLADGKHHYLVNGAAMHPQSHLSESHILTQPGSHRMISSHFSHPEKSMCQHSHTLPEKSDSIHVINALPF